MDIEYCDLAEVVEMLDNLEFLRDIIPKKITGEKYWEIMNEQDSSDVGENSSWNVIFFSAAFYKGERWFCIYGVVTCNRLACKIIYINDRTSCIIKNHSPAWQY